MFGTVHPLGFDGAEIGQFARVGVGYAFGNGFDVPRFGLNVAGQRTFEVVLAVAISGLRQLVKLFDQSFFNTE
jgi:hypothetical protein